MQEAAYGRSKVSTLSLEQKDMPSAQKTEKQHYFIIDSVAKNIKPLSHDTVVKWIKPTLAAAIIDVQLYTSHST